MYVCQSLIGSENVKLFDIKATYHCLIRILRFFLILPSFGCYYCMYGLASEANNVSM